MCLSAFLDACYIARRQDIDADALESLDKALENFWRLREIFRTSGVRPSGFSLPRQHALFHYRRHIEDFGAPGGLCSSITESRHITAVKRPWRRSNRYQALGQMLQTNQRLDKLAAMRSDYIARGMLPAGHIPGRGTSLILGPHQVGTNNAGDDDNDEGPIEEENVDGHVSLASTCGKSIPLGEQLSLIFSSAQLSTGPGRPFNPYRRRKFDLYDTRLPCDTDWHKRRRSISYWCCVCLPLGSCDVLCTWRFKWYPRDATRDHTFNPFMARRCTTSRLRLPCGG
jgi:hypothetical protein